MHVQTPCRIRRHFVGDTYGELLRHCRKGSDRAPQSETAAETSFEIDEYVDINLSNDIKVVDLAQIAELSPFHFSRVFKAATGASPYRDVMNLRLKRGMELLQSTDKPVAEMASILRQSLTPSHLFIFENASPDIRFFAVFKGSRLHQR